MGKEEVRTDEIEAVPDFAITTRDAHERLTALKRFVASELQEGIDYGTIPGTFKPSLWQPGAQKLGNIFGFYPAFELVKELEDWDKPLFMYRYKCRIVSKRDEVTQAECEATCSSMEGKYHWRWIDATPDEKKQAKELEESPDYKWRKARGKTVFQKRVENPDIFDLPNTILRMAQKRAFVGAIITATRCADIFSYDLEAIEEEEETAKAAKVEPKPTAEQVRQEVEDIFGAVPPEMASDKDISNVLELATSTHITSPEREALKGRLAADGVTKSITDGFCRKLKALIAERTEIERKQANLEI